MAEYIKRQDAIEEFENTDYDVFQREGDDGFSFATTIRVLHEIPAAHVRPERYAKKVKFFEDPWTLKKFTSCTACDGKVGPRDKFCKHCGAKFEEVTHEKQDFNP